MKKLRYEIVIKYLGAVLLFNSIFLFLAYGISVYLIESSALPLLFSGFICLIFGTFPFIFVEPQDDLYHSEGISIVVLGWLITCVVGMLPYVMWGGEFSVINAWFESVSGFTTTGSTILNEIESLPKGLLFWRSSTHWIGGIGIIMFVLLILPQTVHTKLTLLNTEMSELSKANFRFRAKKIIIVVATVYVGLTTLETILLKFAGMSFFDAINHSFATIATGGFSTKNMSIAYYNSPLIENIIIFFMVFSGIHFGLLYATITFRRENIFTNPVVRAFILVMATGILLVTLKLWASGLYDFWTSLRYAAFQVVSVGTTTGFATEDTNHWPPFTQIILIYFIIQCAMVGSTSGGLKFDRIYMFIKSVLKQVKIIQHPRAVILLKINDKAVSEQLERQTILFIALYLFTAFIATLMLTSVDVDIFSAFSASIATLGNVGPGFGDVSSLSNFSTIPTSGKFVLTINMLLGRLEIYNIIALLLIKPR